MRRLLFLAALWLPTLAAGQVDRSLVTVFGVGTQSCGSYVAASNKTPHDQTLVYRGESFPSMAGVQVHWIMGFVSATFMAADKEIPTDPDGIVLWVKRFCESNPTKAIFEAANRFSIEHGACVPVSALGCGHAGR